ncbi:hypothetical protein TNCV_3473821 [Trichonephila clavipes]|nr:hypothetical protein TNCV_3473821 [Trichonephila clavipes]
MDYCAEVSYIRCNNGCRLPMEIAFARVNNPHQVFILHMRMLHNVYFTVKDLVCNKSQCERRNKTFNVIARRILKMDMESWWHTLQHFIHDQMGWDAQLAVRSKNQKHFFKTVGGFRNVCIVNLPWGIMCTDAFILIINSFRFLVLPKPLDSGHEFESNASGRFKKKVSSSGCIMRETNG